MLYQLSYASLVERETGIGPATNSLEGCDSTTELLPRRNPLYQATGLLSHPQPKSNRPFTRRINIPIFPIFSRLPPISQPPTTGRQPSRCYPEAARTDPVPHPNPKRPCQPARR